MKEFILINRELKIDWKRKLASPYSKTETEKSNYASKIMFTGGCMIQRPVNGIKINISSASTDLLARLGAKQRASIRRSGSADRSAGSEGIDKLLGENIVCHSPINRDRSANLPLFVIPALVAYGAAEGR